MGGQQALVTSSPADGEDVAMTLAHPRRVGGCPIVLGTMGSSACIRDASTAPNTGTPLYKCMHPISLAFTHSLGVDGLKNFNAENMAIECSLLVFACCFLSTALFVVVLVALPLVVPTLLVATLCLVAVAQLVVVASLARGTKMGTLMGVFIPCLQNILGIIFYIRFSWFVRRPFVLENF
eukprot:Gb_38237 [translate_table: standard]